jgi:acyl-CoA thioester hydrolase
MSNFRFFHPIEVRYGDLDPQGHVNNAKYLTYMETGRIAYVKQLGLWNGGSFLDLGIILAEIRITFQAPILYGTPLQVGVRISRLGNKSLNTEYLLENMEDGSQYAAGYGVLVAYDYHSGQTIPIPETWRSTIHDFEGLAQESLS